MVLDLGNAWHIPDNAEPPSDATMRSPLDRPAPASAIEIFSGNQFKGEGGGAANQHQTGSAVFFKKASTSNWSPPLELKFYARSGNNEYYRALIPTGSFQAGDNIQYYPRIAYDPDVRRT